MRSPTSPVDRMIRQEFIALEQARVMQRRPIERYLRYAVPILGSKRRVEGSIEMGLHYEPEERASLPGWRAQLAEAAGLSAHTLNVVALDECVADAITNELDARIVAWFGDRPRFIEIWHGTGAARHPLTLTEICVRSYWT